MAQLATIARRTFLVGSAAIAGGVAFGVYKYFEFGDNPLARDLKPGEAAITPFVKITADDIILITPRADFGQGAYSIQAYLLAEELDVDPAVVKTEPGPPSAIYYNGTVMEEGVPFPSTEEGFLADTARGASDVMAKLMGLQITGGSTTVPNMFEKLRHAGAVARETLKQAAAVRIGLKRNKLTTNNGRVVLPDGRTFEYQQLASLAATIEPISNVRLRPKSEWRYLGRPFERIDIRAKTTGGQKYGIDLTFDAMVYATVKANPGLGARVKRYDASTAEKMPGVKKVVAIKNGIGVIADKTWHAFKAADAVMIEWSYPDYPINSDEMWKEVEGSFESKTQDSQLKDIGDVEAALPHSDVIDAEYRIPYLVHAPLEPMNAVALYTKERLDIWTGTQIPTLVQSHAAKLADLDVDDVHVHVQAMGGSFGRRLDDDYVMQAIELAMAMTGTPVKLTWTREEDMTHTFPRPMQMSRARGIVKDGRVNTFDLAIAAQSVSSSWLGRVMFAPPGPDIAIIAGAWDQPYAIENYRVTGYRVPEMVPVTPWRAVGASGNGFFHECFLDELIHAAGADPLSERIRLCNDDVSRKVLEAVGELAEWRGARIGENRARGVAFTLSFGVPVAQIIEVTNGEDGIKIDKIFIAADAGKVLDPVNFESQLHGGALFGLAHAMNCETTYENYAAQQTNFHQYEGIRISQIPDITIKALKNNPKIRGIGEPGLPPAAPALANAIFAVTGKRIRELPMQKHITFA